MRGEPGRIHLTFDDGPDPRGTSLVLDALASASAPATFFVTPGAHPELIARTIGEGHSVAYHCGLHVRHGERSRDDVAAEAERDLEWLDRQGVRPRAWRTPWGDLASWTADLAADLGLELWHWSDDSEDWAGHDAASMLAGLDRTVRDGSVVLMHDGVGPGALREDCRATAELVAPLVAASAIAWSRTRGPARFDAGLPGSLMGQATAAALHSTGVEGAIREIGAAAGELDREPRFPAEAFVALGRAGALAFTVPGPDGARPSIAEEWALLRSVAAADGSVGRIFDGHLNAVERIAVAAPAEVADEQLDRVRAGGRLLGVWGADPKPDEGAPAQVTEGAGGDLLLDGAKTFCSGAGGVDAALVAARPLGAHGPPQLCLVEIDETVTVDRTWFRGSGLRASESHRVSFDSTPVVALLGEPGELVREPWFSRDALRTAASWAGMADCAVDDALGHLVDRRRGEGLSELAAGRLTAARGSIDVWLEAAAAAVEAGTPLKSLSIRLRAELIRAAELILSEAAVACGSRPFALGSALDRSRRDLQLFTLQHPIDPMLVGEGERVLNGEASG